MDKKKMHGLRNEQHQNVLRYTHMLHEIEGRLKKASIHQLQAMQPAKCRYFRICSEGPTATLRGPASVPVGDEDTLSKSLNLIGSSRTTIDLLLS